MYDLKACTVYATVVLHHSTKVAVEQQLILQVSSVPFQYPQSPLPRQHSIGSHVLDMTSVTVQSVTMAQ